jgi:hypothetical protein
MYVPYTKHSELAGRLRESEESMAAMIVERGGTKLVDMLHKANPWAGQDCGRLRCLLCTTQKDEGRKNSQDCKKRNCVYETYCMTCMQRLDRMTEEKYGEMGKKKAEEDKRNTRRYIYIGETNRSV